MTNEPQPYQQRVLEERRNLREAYDKLSAFIETETFAGLSIAEKCALLDQHDAMEGYLEALRRRIELWGLAP